MEAGPEGGEVLDGPAEVVVGDVVGGGFAPQEAVISDVLLDGLVLVVAADDRAPQVEVSDRCLEFAGVPPGDLPAEDEGEFLQLADGAVGVQEAVAQGVERGAAAEDEVVAVLDLGEEEGVGQALEDRGIDAAEEGIGALGEADAALPQPAGQPLVLIEAEAGGGRQAEADPDKQGSEPPVVQVEVVLVHPALLELQGIAVGRLAIDTHDDAGRLAGLEDHHNLVGLGAAEVGGRRTRRGAPRGPL